MQLGIGIHKYGDLDGQVHHDMLRQHGQLVEVWWSEPQNLNHPEACPQVELRPGLHKMSCRGQKLGQKGSPVSEVAGPQGLGRRDPLDKLRLDKACLVLIALPIHAGHEQLSNLASQGLQWVMLGIMALLGTVPGQGLETMMPVILQQDVHNHAIQQLPAQQ